MRVGAALQLFEDQRLVLMRRAIDARLACGDAFAGHDHGLHVLQKIVGGAGAGGGGDDHAPGAAVNRDHRPGCQRRSLPSQR